MTHDVFLNFRGEEIRKTFVSHLLSLFKTKYITSFIASEPFEALDHEAMENSLVVVPVISKSYTSSDWWVKDLSRMIECEKTGTMTVVPIFFQVNPLDIVANKYGNVQNETLEMVTKWLYAQVSRKPSFHSSDWEDDSELVDKITSFVSGILISSGSSFYSTSLSPVRSLKLEREFSLKLGRKFSLTSWFRDSIVTRPRRELSLHSFCSYWSEDYYWPLLRHPGMKRRLAKFCAFVRRAESHVLGMCGMEGVGKTTLARALYEEISPQFQHPSYMNNSSGKAFEGPLSFKQMFPREYYKSGSFYGSSDEAVKEMMSHRKVLLVVDGVDNIKQLNGIIKDTSWFGRGSRVIVITQDKTLLSQCEVKDIYEVESPEYEEALAFFSEFAFRQSNPLPCFEELSFRAVHVANRLPLALKMLGLFLRDKEKDEWVSTLRRLEGARDSYASEVYRYIGADDYAPRRPMKVDRHIGVDEANCFPLYCLALE